MRGYLAFTKKEFVEFNRTYKLLIIFAVFLLLGMMNPLTAKLTPMLLEKFMPEGIKITLGEPTALDSWAQFYKNVPQMGLIVVALLFSGLMSQEYSKDTLINMLTKGLPRRTVIFSKLSMAASMWTAAYGLCFAVSWGYTAYFWKADALINIPFAAFCLWIYGLLLILALILGSVLFANSYGSLLFTGGFVGLQFLANIIPNAGKYNPISLAGRNLNLLNGVVAEKELFAPIIISLMLCAALTLISILVFNKKRL